MPRPRRGREDRYSPKTESEAFKQSLYGELTTPEAVEEAQREAETKEKKGKFLGHKNFYFWLYAYTEKHFAKKKKGKYQLPEIEEEQLPGEKKKKKKEKVLPKVYKEAFDFLGWKLDKDVVMAMPRTAGIFALILGVILAGGLYFIFSYTAPPAYECGDGVCAPHMDGDEITFVEHEQSCPQDCDVPSGVPKSEYDKGEISPMILLFILFIPIFITLGIVAYVQKYPINAADSEKMKALTYVPEIMNYMVMQMRLQPNLERAVEFAAEHGSGRIAEEFKDLLWKNNVGIYESIEEGLDDMAYRWEPYSEEFKHAITMMRASVLVPSDIERGMLYDKAIEDILSSTRDKMELYARSMKQPSMYLFYIAVLMPLMIIIMLPVAAAFAGIPVASTPILALLYLFILPLITFLYARMVLAKRPGGYVPPKIPDNHPDLPKKGTARLRGMSLPIIPVTIMLFIVIMSIGMVLESSVKISESQIEIIESDTGKEVEQPSLLQYVIPLAIAIPLSFYLIGISANKRQIQEDIFKMELDFKDAMYLLASRLGEKKPLEDALSYVKKFMPESKVATVLLENVERNIMVMGLTLQTAIFDPTYGAMKFVPSRLMNSAFKIMTDSIELGPEVASTSLVSVSNQIRNVQKINDLMRKLLDDVTDMMNSMARFIAPIVLGIVASLQQVIISVIAPLQSEVGAEGIGSEGARGAFGNVSMGAIEGMATPFEFQLIVAFYIIILVTILSYFAGKIRYGDNRSAILMTIGKTLPIATAVFVAALYMGGNMVGGLAG